MLHYNPQHVSGSTMLILRRSKCVITTSRIVSLSKRLYSMSVESRLQSALNRHTVIIPSPSYRTQTHKHTHTTGSILRCQTPTKHTTNICEPLRIISVKYSSILPDDGLHTIRNMLE